MTTSSGRSKAYLRFVSLSFIAFAACVVEDGGTGNGKSGGKDSNNPDSMELEECNGLDENGNDVVDEGCSCTVDNEQDCFPSAEADDVLERCQLGTQSCGEHGGSGSWGECVDYVKCEVVEDEFVYGEDSDVVRPIDVIMIVDQSGSMADEIAQIKINLNAFAETLLDSGVDYHFILVARRGTDEFGICVPEPLAGPDCADSERFRQIDHEVQSWDSLSIAKEEIDAIESFMRTGSQRVFIEVSDDDPGASGYDDDVKAQEFHDFLKARDGYDDYVFHSIVGMIDTCPTAAADGLEYEMLSMWTGGLVESICTADWAKTLDRFAEDVITKAAHFTIEAPPASTGDLGRLWDIVDVSYVKNGKKTAQSAEAWRYDEETNSVQIVKGPFPDAGSKVIVRYRRVAEESPTN